MSAPSLYSQLTGMPRKAPEPKMPVKREEVDWLTWRFSGSTFSSAERRKEVVASLSCRKNQNWQIRANRRRYVSVRQLSGSLISVRSYPQLHRH